jgi:hypothetical protein
VCKSWYSQWYLLFHFTLSNHTDPTFKDFISVWACAHHIAYLPCVRLRGFLISSQVILILKDPKDLGRIAIVYTLSFLVQVSDTMGKKHLRLCLEELPVYFIWVYISVHAASLAIYYYIWSVMNLNFKWLQKSLFLTFLERKLNQIIGTRLLLRLKILNKWTDPEAIRGVIVKQT